MTIREICTVNDCGRDHYGLGYCSVHYYRFKRNGHTDLVRTGDPCSVDGCTRVHYGLGYCRRHHRAFTRWGDPLASAPPRARDDVRRFWSKVDRTGECWLWTAGKTPLGYGHFWLDGTTVNAHRFAYEQEHGPIGDGLVIDHLCRNPPCVNPAHLEPVPHRTNTIRGEAQPAVNARKTHCIHGHEFTAENTYLYRGGRHCRSCQRETAARFRAAARQS